MRSIIFIICWCVLACTDTAQQRPDLAFYYWQTTLDLPADYRTYLDSAQCTKCYIKVLDVGIDRGTGAVVPYSKLTIKDSTALENRAIAQTVFITNEVFRKIAPEKIPWLANQIKKALPFDRAVETQIDCDWTGETKALFFEFMRSIKAILPQKMLLSATIRLHQYKNPAATGIPPADRGMLMLYNTGDIENQDTPNSVFASEDALRYVEGVSKPYPLPLDLALAIYDWSLIYRDGTLWKIYNGIPPDWQDTTRFLAEDAHRYRVRVSTFVNGHYLRTGDLIKTESMTQNTLEKAAQIGRKIKRKGGYTTAFFHLDSVTKASFPAHQLTTICDILSQ